MAQTSITGNRLPTPWPLLPVPLVPTLTVLQRQSAAMLLWGWLTGCGVKVYLSHAIVSGAWCTTADIVNKACFVRIQSWGKRRPKFKSRNLLVNQLRPSSSSFAYFFTRDRPSWVFTQSPFLGSWVSCPVFQASRKAYLTSQSDQGAHAILV